jgi:hypothetical protein
MCDAGKKKFAVIKAYQDYDYLEGLECVISFPTEQEAKDYIKSKEDDRMAAFKRRDAYVEQFVAGINPPDTQPQFMIYTNKFSFGCNVTQENFKPFLKVYLSQHCLDGEYLRKNFKEFENYYPSAFLPYENLFVVEII